MEARFVSPIRSFSPFLGSFFFVCLLLGAPSEVRSENSPGQASAEAKATAKAKSPPGPLDPDIKRGRSCSGGPSSAALVDTLPTYIKELVVQWPRAGSRSGEEGCVSVARLTVIDHQGLITTLSVEVHSGAQTSPPSDYRVIDSDGMPRAELTAPSLAQHPEVVISLAGPPTASRDSLERTLEFVPIERVAQAFGAL